MKRIVTGDEKWVVYSNVKCKRSWSKKMNRFKPLRKPIFIKTRWFSVWWVFKRILFFELLSDNTTINSEVYCDQLNKLNDSLNQKRPELFNRKGIVFHQDNARSHTSFVTQKFLQLGWDVLHTTPTMFSRSCTIGLLLVQVPAKFFRP